MIEVVTFTVDFVNDVSVGCDLFVQRLTRTDSVFFEDSQHRLVYYNCLTHLPSLCVLFQ
ncbi:hypothetical protein D3C80_2081990 [compost metagenome]